MNTPTVRNRLQAIRQRLVTLARSRLRPTSTWLLLGVVIMSATPAQVAAAGLGIGSAVHTQQRSLSDAGVPNRFDPHTDASSVSHPAPLQPSGTGTSLPPGTLKRTQLMPMQPGQVALHVGQPAHFLGSDGQLEVSVPAGAVTADDLAQAGGELYVQMRQVVPGSGSNAGGSGHVTFGTYVLQLVTAGGQVATRGLRAPVTLTLHYGAKGGGADLQHAFVVFNSGLAVGTSLLPLALGSVRPAASAAPGRLGAYASQPTLLDAARHTLSVTATLASPTLSSSWDTDSPVAAFGNPDPFNVNLAAGALTFDEPINVPAGPGGLTPPISLTYSSESVAEQHNPQAAAPWVGEGWTMSLGSISWAEHNVTSSCAPGCGNTWESNWKLNDAFGTSADLIPPNMNISTYYDDTPNTYYNNGYTWTNAIPWHTAPESHARIFSYVGPLTLPYNGGNLPARPPCFRVFLPNGVMEEFGCTIDSLQWYYVPSNNYSDYVTRWNLDLITDPQGNQIHLTYQRDMATYQGVSYPRDEQLATIEYDSPTCHDAHTMCTGSAWQPLMRVNFSAHHNPAHRSGYANSNPCQTAPNERCDDPSDLSGNNGIAAPQIQSTFTLDDIQAQVRASGTAGWNTLRDYQIWYENAGPATITDPITGKQESVAGVNNLTKIVVLGSDGSTQLPTRSFTYVHEDQFYQDSVYVPTPSSNCGWSWNKGTNGVCPLWSTNYDGNSQFIATADNGQGLHEIFTWSNALNNTHGVNGGGANTSNPFYCGGAGPTYPCDEASDENWSHIVLTQREAQVYRASSGGNVLIKSDTSYGYTLNYPLKAQPCSDCVAGFDWGNQNDGDALDYYNGRFMGFAQASMTHPDGAKDVHYFWSTEGWGLYDTNQVTCATSSPCHDAPWWSTGSLLHGRVAEVDSYDVDGTTLLSKTQTQYQATCPPTGVSGSGGTYGKGWGNWNGNLVAILDHNNPVAACDIQTKQVDTYTYDAAPTSWAVPHQTVSYAYDNYGRETTMTTTRADSSNGGSPSTTVLSTQYIWNDAVNTSQTSASGSYLIDFPADIYTSDSGNTVHYTCLHHDYDGHGLNTGQQSYLTLGEAGTSDRFIDCGRSSNGFTTTGILRVTSTYDIYGNVVAGDDPDANLGDTTHVGCTVGGQTYSTCETFDGVHTTLPMQATNALKQSTTLAYGSSSDPNGGFGLWATGVTDANGQSSTLTYDPLGRATSTTLPGETSGLTTTTTRYTVWCAATGAQTPCEEIDTTQRLDSQTTVTSRAFYDGWGHLIETRTAAPGSQDVVRYASYDPSGRLVFQSIPYFVAAYTGGPGAAAFATPDANQPGTTTTYTNLRQTAVKDALSHTATTTLSIECGEAGDSACYVFAVTIDANSHQTSTYTDALGREIYARTDTGNNNGNYAAYATIRRVYDAVGNLTQVFQPDGSHSTTYSYDDAGRTTGMTDADRGTESYSYDADGNLTQSVDARGAAGTTYAGYDGVDRQIWRNTSNTPTGAYVTYAYDSTANGNMGVGRLTGETFSGGPSNAASGSDSFVYDARGQQTKATLTVAGTNYPLQMTYDDASNLLTQTYPDGELVTTGYTAQGWLSSLTTKQGGSTTTLLGAAAYTGPGGAAGQLTSATLGGGTYTYTAAYDTLARPQDLKLVLTSNNATRAESQPSYDAVGNVVGVTTTLPAGTDVQAFCYDEQNRLTWAGSVGTPPCTGTPITPGTLTGAQYTQSFSYDTLDRLTSGPLGSYSYGDAAHLHAATAIGAGYTASYDAAGNMTCQAPQSGKTCVGASTGRQLTYDNEGRLAAWQNTPTAPTKTDGFLYDGAGNRVAQQTTVSGTTTTTVYVGALEEVATTASSTTTTAYYYAGGKRIALSVNGAISYLGTDLLGSATVALDGSGNVEASILYAPYGTVRYSSGTMPTDYGFTGQHADSTTGLDYYGARYYDPQAGQFISADTDASGGLNRYAYVQGNPETLTDPTGHGLSPWQTAILEVYYCAELAATCLGAYSARDWTAMFEQAVGQQPSHQIQIVVEHSGVNQESPITSPGPDPTATEEEGTAPKPEPDGNRAFRRHGKQPESNLPRERPADQGPGFNDWTYKTSVEPPESGPIGGGFPKQPPESGPIGGGYPKQPPESGPIGGGYPKQPPESGPIGGGYPKLPPETGPIGGGYPKLPPDSPIVMDLAAEAAASRLSSASFATSYSQWSVNTSLATSFAPWSWTSIAPTFAASTSPGSLSLANTWYSPSISRLINLNFW